MPEGTIDLRSGLTVWRAKHGPPRYFSPLLNDASCEVVIIGGGITGALIAWELVQIGVDCILIDQSTIGGGSTSASTALLLYELDTPMAELAGQLGEDDAVACYLACRDAIGKIRNVTDELGNDCGFRMRASYYLAEHPSHVEGLMEECSLRRKHGMNVEWLRGQEIGERFSFNRPGAILSREAAEVDVVQLVDVLIERSIERGVRVYAESPMASFRETVKGVSVRLDCGCEVNASKAVFATGYESERYLGRRLGLLKSTYAIATSPITEFTGWHERSLLWTSARPYLYLRTTDDRRAVVGGGDIDYHDPISRDALLQAKAAELETSFRSMFPLLDCEIECAWAGTFGETKDSLAYIGTPAERPSTYFALGYGGNGIVYSVIAAEIIRDLYRGVPNDAARLFRFGR